MNGDVAPVSAPDMTKPHGTGDVWDPSINAWKLPAGAAGSEEDTQAQDIIKNIFATNNLTQEQQDWWNKNVFNTPEERKAFLAKTDEERKAYMSNINQANIATRDAAISAEHRKSQYDRQMADATAQVENANAKAKADLEANANNFSILQGTTGRLKSRNMANAISQQLDMSKKIYTDLIATNDRYLKAVAEEYQYTNTVASNEYNDAMGRMKQDLLRKVEALQKT
jgi:primosomal protein N'